MVAIARFAVANPRRVLAGWLAVVGLLATFGLGVEGKLHRSSLTIPGTASERAADLARQRFGDGTSLVVLLRGPRAAADRQGRHLSAALERHRGLSVLAPWSPGAGRVLRPQPGSALLIVRADRPFEEVSRHVVPQVRADIGRVTSAPVQAHLSGYADIAAGIHGSSVAAIRHAEIIAAPLLLFVLLLVFRSPIAAALPLGAGLTTIAAGQGVLALANGPMSLDVVALNLTSMMGLALGVDYALLLVSRFREELAAGADDRAAALVAVETAGRTAVFAGAALAAAMVAALFVAPGKLLVSASFGVIVAVVLSVAGVLTALPAALAVIGARIDRWRFGSTLVGDSRFGRLALRALRRPALAGGLVLACVVALAAPALWLESGPPDPRVLPAGSPHRADFEAIRHTLGGGWTAPYEITIAARRGPITDPARLAALDRWQRRLAARSDVVAVLGVGQIARRTRGLERVPRVVRGAGRALRRGLRDQARLASGLHRAGAGVDQLRRGLVHAADGAERLHAGGGRAAGAADALHAGLAQARTGARRLRSGIAQAQVGARSLASGAARMRHGARRLASGLASAGSGTRTGTARVSGLAAGLSQAGDGLQRLREPAQLAEGQLRTGLAALDRMAPTSKLDPQYRRAYEAVATALGAISGRHPATGATVRPGYGGLDAELARAGRGATEAAGAVRGLAGALGRLRSGLARLETGSRRLLSGATSLDRGGRRLARGLNSLDAGSRVLLRGLARLDRGDGSLADGTRRLRRGAAALQRALSAGAAGAGELQQGVRRLDAGTAAAGARTRSLARAMGPARGLAGAARSGYFVLAALDGAGPELRKSAAFAVNLDRGGSAAQIAVISRGNMTRAGHPLRRHLEAELDRLERETGTVARLGGPAATLQDFDAETSGRMPLLILALAAVTYLVLVPILRSVLLPALAVGLNLLTVAAAFGVLVLLFEGSAPLGGPGFLDAIMVSGVFSVVFGLSIDYEVFLLARMREGYALTGTTDGAIAYGLRHTAGVVTGAALIMTGVFVAFALSNIASMRQLGVGLTVAVLLDATLVRLVLLPAAIRMCGPAIWWFPRRLTRPNPARATAPRPDRRLRQNPAG